MFVCSFWVRFLVFWKVLESFLFQIWCLLICLQDFCSEHCSGLIVHDSSFLVSRVFPKVLGCLGVIFDALGITMVSLL